MNDLLENKQKFLMFGHHNVILDELEGALIKKKQKYIRIDGTVPSKKRHEYVNQFQNDPETLVAVLSITAAGTGLTLTAASIVVFTEMHWTPAIMV